MALPSKPTRATGGSRPGSAPASPKARALQWLTQREHSREELRRKLQRLIGRGGEAHDADPDGTPAVGARTGPDAGADSSAGPPRASARAVDVDVEALLDDLQAQGWLSDARFAASRVNTRAPRHGRQRIAAELSQHGLKLDPDTDRALRATELERARAVWSRKFGRPAADARERARQVRFLAGRGFAMDVIRRVVQGVDSNSDGD